MTPETMVYVFTPKPNERRKQLPDKIQSGSFDSEMKKLIDAFNELKENLWFDNGMKQVIKDAVLVYEKFQGGTCNYDDFKRFVDAVKKVRAFYKGDRTIPGSIRTDSTDSNVPHRNILDAEAVHTKELYSKVEALESLHTETLDTVDALVVGDPSKYFPIKKTSDIYDPLNALDKKIREMILVVLRAEDHIALMMQDAGYILPDPLVRTEYSTETRNTLYTDMKSPVQQDEPPQKVENERMKSLMQRFKDEKDGPLFAQTIRGVIVTLDSVYEKFQERTCTYHNFKQFADAVKIVRDFYMKKGRSVPAVSTDGGEKYVSHKELFDQNAEFALKITDGLNQLLELHGTPLDDVVQQSFENKRYFPIKQTDGPTIYEPLFYLDSKIEYMIELLLDAEKYVLSLIHPNKRRMGASDEPRKVSPVDVPIGTSLDTDAPRPPPPSKSRIAVVPGSRNLRFLIEQRRGTRFGGTRKRKKKKNKTTR